MHFLDDLIRDAMARGEFDNLPGSGKPLALDDDTHTPEPLRLAHRLLRENGLAPDWILEGRALDDERAALKMAADRLLRQRQAALNDAVHAATPALARADAETRWQEQRAAYLEQVTRYNRRALTFNLKAPAGIAHKPILRAEHLLGER